MAKYLGPINESIIALVIGTVANHKIPITAPNKIARVAEGGDKTKIVIANDLIKYINASGKGLFIFVPNQPKLKVPIIFVTPIIPKDHPATSAEIPFDIRVSGYARNIANGKGQLMGLLKSTAAKEKGIRVVEGYGIFPVKTNKSMEFNLPAAYFDVLGKDKTKISEGLIIGSGPFAPKPFTVEVNDSTWSIDLTREKFALPFGIELTKFQKEDHPGTARAREYSSDVIKIENGQSAGERLISMNQPMRDQGYTLYQASWGPEGAKPGDPLYTSLAVSYNPADQWPKYGTYVISIGMTIHFVQRLIVYLRRNARSRKKNKRKDKVIGKNNKDCIKELYEKI